MYTYVWTVHGFETQMLHNVTADGIMHGASPVVMAGGEREL